MSFDVSNDIVAEQTKVLAEFIAKTTFEDLSSNLIQRANLAIADTIGVMIRGSLEPEMDSLYKKLPHDNEAALIKKGFPRTNIAMAGFANTTAACIIELDEGTSPSGHPALHVLPAALALAQKMDSSGKDLITAFILGYEVQSRLQKATKLRLEIYPHGNTGHVGATVAVGKLMGWNAEQFRQGINCAAALPIATSHAPTFVGSTIATTFASLSSPIAFIVKDLVESGFTGYDSALGDTFGSILGKEFNALALTEALGIEYGIMENYFKFHANCAITHPAIEASANALDFKVQHDEFPPYKPGKMLSSNDIKCIKIIQGNKNTPRVMNLAVNKLSAKFSLPYSLAVFLVTGNASADAYTEELLENKEVRSIEKLIELEIDPNMSDMIWAAKILIELNNGEVITGESSDIYGRFENPANQQDLYNKFCELTKEVLNDQTKNYLWDILNNLDKQESIKNIL